MADHRTVGTREEGIGAEVLDEVAEDEGEVGEAADWDRCYLEMTWC